MGICAKRESAGLYKSENHKTSNIFRLLSGGGCGIIAPRVRGRPGRSMLWMHPRSGRMFLPAAGTADCELDLSRRGEDGLSAAAGGVFLRRFAAVSPDKNIQEGNEK
ncbi:hypothetical protein B5F36_10555 [Anaerofilum sp. An201]|nr:hypothetical protein B5F36_10555 [Anaerofilum sp. An201]